MTHRQRAPFGCAAAAPSLSDAPLVSGLEIYLQPTVTPRWHPPFRSFVCARVTRRTTPYRRLPMIHPLHTDTPRARGLLSGPAYEPPYDGAVQDEFAWHIVKYLREDAVLLADAELETDGALFNVDFVVEVADGAGRKRRIGFECGGTRSLRDHQRRLRRDASLVASGAVDALYRLRGSDLLDHVEDCLYLVAQWEAAAGAGCTPGAGGVPDAFSERGRINLHTLATREAKGLRLRPEQSAAMVTYEIDPQQEEYFSERHLWHAANGTNPFLLLRHFDRRFAAAWEPHVDEAAPAPQRLRPTGS